MPQVAIERAPLAEPGDDAPAIGSPARSTRTGTGARAGTAAATRPPSPRARLLRALLLSFVAVGAVVFVGRVSVIRAQEPLDLDINLVGAERLVDHAPLYEGDEAARARAVELGGPAMAGAFTRPTNSFVGPPSTALVHVPFTWLDHDLGVALFRVLALAGMVAAVALVARVLPPGRRLDGFLLGAGALLLASATSETLALGQGHELVMLGLAAAIWGTARQRWGWVGAGLALATVLKITPILLVAYLVLRGRRQLLPAFVATATALTAAAAAVGRPGDLLVWARDVAPEISRGIVRPINQSLPALVQRLLGPAGLDGTGQLGAARLLAGPLLLGAAVLLWRARRDRPLDPLELGVLLLVGLVAGPLTWMHYTAWAVLPLVLLADPARWPAGAGRPLRFAALAGAIALLAARIASPSAADVALHPALRLTTSPRLLGVLLLLGVAATGLAAAGAARGPGDQAVPAPAAG